MTDNRPDLPTLELVETKIKGIIPFALVPFIVAAFFTLMYSATYRYLGRDRWFVLASIGLLLVLSLVQFVRWLKMDYFWQIDDRGVFARNRLGRRFIAWGNIESATEEKRKSSFKVYRIASRDSSIVISEARLGRSDQGDRFIASLWQYLRKYGKSGGIELTPAASSLWDEIPDYLPREMDWKNSQWAAQFIISILVAPMFAVIIGIQLYAVCATYGWIILALFGLSVAVAAVIACKYKTVRRFVLCEDYFEAQLLRRKITVRWSDLTYARWATDSASDDAPRNLVLGSSNPRTEVIVPSRMNDQESNKLILSIIRRVRTTKYPQALSIPWYLRLSDSSQKPAPVQDNCAVLKLAPLIIFTAPSPLVFIGWGLICLVVWGNSLSGITYGIGAAVICLVTWPVVSSWTMEADRDGITERFLWWRKLIKWSDISSVIVKRTLRSGRLHRIDIHSGKRAIKIDFTNSSGKTRDKFAELVLAQLPDRLLDEPWKSRPWQGDS